MLKRTYFTFCCIFLAWFGHLHAQPCYGNGQAEAMVCAYSILNLNPSTPCANCSYQWITSGLVSGQSTAFASYQYNYDGTHNTYEYPGVFVYDSLNNCSYSDIYQTTVGRRPSIPMPTLQNGPWDGDTFKIWLYARDRYTGLTAGTYDYYPTWSIQNGTIVQSSITPDPFVPAHHWDTLRVKWHGGGPMQLTEARSTGHWANFGLPFTCNWNSIQSTTPNPPVNIFHPPVCVGNAASFYTFPYVGATFTWSVTNGNIIAGQGTNNAHIIMSGNGTVTLSVDTSGSPVVVNRSVTPTVPNINLGPDQSFCQSSGMVLNAGPGFTNYLWSTGATSQSINATASGSYSVTATVNGACQAIDTIQLTMIPTTPPNLGPDVNTCTFPVTLNAGGSYSSYAWSNGASTSSISVGTAGQYRVTVTDGNGCISTDTVHVFNRSLNANLGPDRNICANVNTVISSGVPSNNYFIWSTGATTPVVQVSGLGQQNIWCHVSNIYGCSDSDSVVITGVMPATPNLGPDQTVCPGTAVTLNAGPGYASYSWMFGAGTNQTATVTGPGQIWVQVGDTNGCYAYDTVQILNYPHVPVNLGPDLNVCQPSVTLNAGAGYTTYTWSNGAATQSTVITTAGPYMVTVTDANGCSSIDTINITFTNFNFDLGNDTTFCEGGSVLLDPGIGGSATYNWSNGPFGSTQTVTAPGTHQIGLTVTNSLGCSFSDTIIVTIDPAPGIFLGNDTVLCPDTTITLDAGAGASTYAWSTGASSQSIVANGGGNFGVTVSYANGCQRYDNIAISEILDCVFPGDVNYDGVANGSDIIALGTVLGRMGYFRQNASTSWYGQRAPDWASTITIGVNTKQADTDGDRYTTLADTVAIHNNFGQTHTKANGIQTGDARLRVTPLSNPVVAGGTAVFGVFLEDVNGGFLDSLYGLTLDLGLPAVQDGYLRSVDASQAWFAPAGQQVVLNHWDANTANLAISRISGTDTSGMGLVYRLEYALDSNMANGSNTTFLPNIIASEVFQHNLSSTSPTVQVDPVTVLGVNKVDPRILRHIRIWPVPASNKLNILIEGPAADRIALVDVMGRLVYETKGEVLEETSIDTQNLPAGQYSLLFQLGDELITKKVVIAH